MLGSSRVKWIIKPCGYPVSCDRLWQRGIQSIHSLNAVCKRCISVTSRQQIIALYALSNSIICAVIIVIETGKRGYLCKDINDAELDYDVNLLLLAVPKLFYKFQVLIIPTSFS